MKKDHENKIGATDFEDAEDVEEKRGEIRNFGGTEETGKGKEKIRRW